MWIIDWIQRGVNTRWRFYIGSERWTHLAWICYCMPCAFHRKVWNSCKTDNFYSRTKYILNHKPHLYWANILWESQEYTCISIWDMIFLKKGKSFFEEWTVSVESLAASCSLVPTQVICKTPKDWDMDHYGRTLARLCIFKELRYRKQYIWLMFYRGWNSRKWDGEARGLWFLLQWSPSHITSSFLSHAMFQALTLDVKCTQRASYHVMYYIK